MFPMLVLIVENDVYGQMFMNKLIPTSYTKRSIYAIAGPHQLSLLKRD